MKKKIITIVMAVGLAPIATHAQEAWSLRQCIDYAIEHNVSVLQTQNTAEQQKVDVNTKKWARLPNLNGSGGEGFSWGRTSTLVKDETTGNYNSVYVNTSSTNTSFSLNTNVPLFTGFSIPNQYSLAKLNLKAAIADLEKAKEDIAVNIASSFLQVLFKEELSKVAKEQVALSKEQLNRSLRLNEVGKASSAQVAEAKTRVAQDELSAVQADNDYRLALLDLSQLLELPTMEGFKITAPELEPQFTPLTPPDEVFVQAAASRPSILAAQYRLEGSENSIRIAQSNYYPQLSLNGSLGTDYYSTLDRNFKQQMNDNFSKYIGFSLSIPIFNRFETRNKIRTARLQQSYLSMQVENVKKSLYKEIQQAWYSAVAAESKYNSSTVAVDANQESFRLMSQKLENGKATSVEYNESKLNLMKALSDRIQAKYDYIFRTKILDFYKGKPIQ
jgi:outer membrane protein